MMKLFIAHAVCMLSFAGFSDVLYWQLSSADEHMLFINSIVQREFNAVTPIEDTILGECLFTMTLKRLRYDEDDDWIARVLESSCDADSAEKWNSMKIHCY